jgi:hypothetical protein
MAIATSITHVVDFFIGHLSKKPIIPRVADPLLLQPCYTVHDKSNLLELETVLDVEQVSIFTHTGLPDQIAVPKMRVSKEQIGVPVQLPRYG